MLSIHDEGPPPPCPQAFNMAAYVLARAGAHPEKTALAVIGGAEPDLWSYARLARAVFGTAGALRAAGLGRGDKMVLRLGNSVDFPITYLAAIAIDAVPVPLSAQLTAAELSPILAEIGPAAVAWDRALPLPENDARRFDLEDLRRMREHAPASPVTGDPDRLAYIVYTSGTSGRPRAVMHAHRAVWARRMMWADWYDLRADDRLLHAGAFNWTYTLGTGLMDPWSVGATALIPAEGTDHADLARLLAEHDATIFAAAPGVYRRLLANFGGSAAPSTGAAPLPSLRHGLSAGEKLPDATRESWRRATGTAIYEALGMSECSTFVSGAPGRPAPAGSAGRPQRGRRVAVVDAGGTPVPLGEPGILAVSLRDPGMMLGYFGQPEETRDRQRGEWFLTGDTVSMEKGGAITYLGRQDDMMNAGGYRVSPLEVEAAFSGFDGIEAAAACEVSVKADTTVIALFYAAGSDIDPKALQEHAAARLARYKCPRIFQRVERVAQNANGKINRRAMRQHYEARDDQA